MLNFIFNNPTRVYFGRGQVSSLSRELSGCPGKVLLVTGMGSVKKNGIFGRVTAELDGAGVEYTEIAGIKPNPRVEKVYEGIEICRRERIGLILAVGGGSVIDTAKAVAAGAAYEGDVWDLFETDAVPESALPVGTVLTLSATGSEMNANTVIMNEGKKQKVSLSAPVLRPVFSVLDPEYTFTVNAYHTAAGVADIMAHVFEYYFAPVPHAEVQEAIEEAILRICVRFGPVVLAEPRNYDARANIMWASTLALNGVCGRGKMSDWTCHAIEHEISARTDVSHGAGLAILLPNYMKVVSEKFGPEKFVDYGVNVWNIPAEKRDDLIAGEAVWCTRDFFDSMGLPSTLKEIGIQEEEAGSIAENAFAARSVAEGFDQLSPEEIARIVELSM